MTANTANGAATRFGRQMKKMRESHGWTLRQMHDLTKVDYTTLSRVERGQRPPTETLAHACDRIFPELRGWFLEFYDSSRTWMPPGFRDWPEIEAKAESLRVWAPSIVHGLLQTRNYAEALIRASLGVTEEIVTARLAARTNRQRKVIDRASSWFIVDELALYREVGGPSVMAEQCRHLITLAGRFSITITVMPGVAHGVNAGEIILSDHAAYAEHTVAGYTYTDDQTVSVLAARFDTLRGECYRVSESVEIIERLGEIWASGANPLTVTATEGHA
jgi:transcriptional regulator with XRE-family HTH domain